MRKIKEIKLEMAELRAEYELRMAALQSEISAIQKARGYKPVVPEWPRDHYEQGRSARPMMDRI